MREWILIAVIGAVLCWIAPANAECTEDNFDAWKVAKALQQGLSKEALLAHVDASRAELGPERMEKIRSLIDEVYRLAPPEAESWWNAHYKTCPKEDEA